VTGERRDGVPPLHDQKAGVFFAAAERASQPARTLPLDDDMMRSSS
jgi:hypothetical protein